MKLDSIRALLAPFEDYLSKQGIVFPIELETEFQQHKLAAALASHSASTPPELVERLEMISLLHGTQSTLQFEKDHADLLAQCRDEKDSAADVAVKMFLKAPHIVWREFDRLAAKCQRTFSVFRAADGQKPEAPTPEILGQIEKILGPWFGSNARSNWCRVRHLESEDGITFLIYHGDLVNRVTVLQDDGSTRSELFRPERLDIVRYRHATGEWHVSGKGSTLRSELRNAFSTVFHRSVSALKEVCDYTLEPLKSGRDIFDCRGGGAVVRVRLVSVVFRFKTSRVTLNQGDVLDNFRTFKATETNLEKAELEFRIVGLRYPVRVTIDAKNRKLKSSSHIPAIEQWLDAAGFRKPVCHAAELPLLEIA